MGDWHEARLGIQGVLGLGCPGLGAPLLGACCGMPVLPPAASHRLWSGSRVLGVVGLAQLVCRSIGSNLVVPSPAGGVVRHNGWLLGCWLWLRLGWTACGG